MPRTTVRPARIRALSALAGAVAGGLVTALVLAAVPAQGQVAIPVNCSNDKVVLEWDHMSYDLEGTCGVVVVAADHTTVSMPSATRLVVRGHGNDVEAKTVTALVVRGRDNQVASPSVRRVRLSSPGSTVDVEGLVEQAVLRRDAGHLTARQVTALVVRGAHHQVRARRGYDVRLPGDRNRIAFGRVDDLVVTGDRNVVRVRRGSTDVDDAGSHNRVRVNRRR